MSFKEKCRSLMERLPIYDWKIGDKVFGDFLWGNTVMAFNVNSVRTRTSGMSVYVGEPGARTFEAVPIRVIPVDDYLDPERSLLGMISGDITMKRVEGIWYVTHNGKTILGKTLSEALAEIVLYPSLTIVNLPECDNIQSIGGKNDSCREPLLLGMQKESG